MGILSVLYKFDNQSMKLFGKLFDSKVQPVLLYAAEIWGLEDDYCYQIEKKHMFALKRFLGVGQMTPNNMIYGDTVRYPLYINAYVRAVRYWLKITKMNEKRLPYKAYLMLLHLDEQGKNNRVTKIRTTLFRFGFGYVWQNKGVQEVNLFIRCLICLYVVLDKDSLTTAGRTGRVKLMQVIDLIFYRQFKMNHVQAAYLSVDVNKYIRNSLIKFRFGVSPIVVHSLQHKAHAYTDTVCPLCRAAVENEVHFTLCCSALKDLRQRLIPDKFYSQPSSFRLVLLLSTENKVIIKNFAIFLYFAFKRRELLLPE